jgi:hypothetical protein
VESDTITKMNAVFEPPVPDKVSWERHCHVVQAGSAKLWWENGLPWHALGHAFFTAIPPVSQEPDEEEVRRRKAEGALSQTAIHHADLAMRARIGKEMQVLGSSSSKQDKKELAARLNAARKELMSDAKRQDAPIIQALNALTEAGAEPAQALLTLFCQRACFTPPR